MKITLSPHIIQMVTTNNTSKKQVKQVKQQKQLKRYLRADFRSVSQEGYGVTTTRSLHLPDIQPFASVIFENIVNRGIIMVSSFRCI